MKNINRLAALLMFWAASAALHAAPVVFFDFNGDGLADTDVTVAANGSLTAGLYVSGVDALHGGLVSWGAQIDFDNTVLTGTGYSLDSLWPVDGINNMLDNAAGRAELLGSRFSGLTGTLKLADIFFTASSVPNSGPLSSSELFPASTAFSAFAGADGYDYDPEVVFATTTVTVSAVPVPGALLLFLSGMAGLSAAARRRTARA